MSYILEPTDKTPKIKVDKTNGKLSLSGISIPENPYDFYSPMIENIEEYIENPCELTEFSIHLEYFNTSTALVIRNILRKLEPLSKSSNLEVKWIYEENTSITLDRSIKDKFWKNPNAK